jgi:HPt (histidine-containing phosphotransfer) domain-containing protein
MDHAGEEHRIVSEFADDPEMRELIELFVSELPERVSSLEAAWRDERVEEARRVAHQIKGASGGYGFPSLGEAAARLESALGSAEDDLSRARAQLDELIDLCHRTSP